MSWWITIRTRELTRPDMKTINSSPTCTSGFGINLKFRLVFIENFPNSIFRLTYSKISHGHRYWGHMWLWYWISWLDYWTIEHPKHVISLRNDFFTYPKELLFATTFKLSSCFEMFGASSWIKVRAAEFIHCPSNCGSALDFYRSSKWTSMH